MTITSAEKIGIGTGSPSGTLHINSTANTNATTTYITRGDGTNNLPASIDTQTSLLLANSSDTYSNYLSIQSAPTGTSGVNFGDSADENIGQIGYFNNGDTMRFKVGATEKMRLTSDGLTFNGDTAAANALDDYEEGTWTPVIFGVTKTNQGYYTKVGRMVTITFCNQNGMTLNDGDKADIGGLPFSKIDSNWETGSVPSACFSDATSSYNHRVMTGRQKSNNYIELVNRSGVAMTTSDPMQMTMTYHTS